jgi:hypothetical protein
MGEQKHEVALDTPIRIPGEFENPTVIITALPTRKFQSGGLEFEYPASFRWEADLSNPARKEWVLRGETIKLEYVWFPKTTNTVAWYAGFFAPVLNAAESDITDAERTLNDHTYRGKFVSGKTAGRDATMEFLQVPSRAGLRILMVRDYPPKNMSSSKEKSEVMEMLAKTLRDTAADAAPDHEKDD